MKKQNQTKVIIRDFVVPARIGIYPKEHEAPQRIRVSIDVTLADPVVNGDDISQTLSYEGLVQELRGLTRHHFNLAETLADHLAGIALADPRAADVTVKVEKLDVYPEGSVGVEITRIR